MIQRKKKQPRAARGLRGSSAKRFRPFLEELEARTVPAWNAVGPLPQSDWVFPDSLFAENVSGRITSIAFSTDFDGLGGDALFIGTAGGGIWRTDGPFGANPTWTAVGGNPTYRATGQVFDRTNAAEQQLAAGIAAIGSLAVDPTNQRIIYAGLGEANYSLDSRYGSGIMKSTDGGTTWEVVATGGTAGGAAVSFFRHSVSKIVVDPTNHDFVYAVVVPAVDGMANAVDDGAAATAA